MTEMKTRSISTLTELSRMSAEWNDLWSRSQAWQSTSTAEMICNWIESFSADGDFHAVIVESQGKLVGAVPLVSTRVMSGLPAYGLPINCWSNSGDLLVDENADLGEICRRIVTAIRRLPKSFLSFDEIQIDTPRWQSFLRALRAQRRDYRISSAHSVAVVEILHEWEAYQKSWSGNHRHAVKKSKRRLAEVGQITVERIREDSPALEVALRKCFEIENLGWKGESGTSVLKTPGMFDFMLREARIAAQHEMLDLWLLRLDQRIIAFEYCHIAKGRWFSHKISYDPDFKTFGPGRLLRYFQLQTLHQDPDAQLFDMLGTICPSKAKWATSSYRTARLVAATEGRISNLVMKGMKAAHPVVHRLRGRANVEDSTPELGARGYLELASGSGESPATRPTVDQYSGPAEANPQAC